MIDVHVHLHPPRLYAAIRRWFAERSPWVIDHPTDPAVVAAALRDHGVDRFVFCSYAHKPGMAAELNAWLAATARELAGVGWALATVHPDDPDPTADARLALGAGCIGLKVHEDVQRVHLDDPRLAGSLAEVAAADGFVLVHVGHIPWSDQTDDGPARIARVLDAHPRLRVVVAHFGVPDSERYLAMASTEPRLFLDTTMVFAPESPMRRAFDARALERVATQIVLGTDYPNIPHAWDGDLRGLRALGLDPATLRAITGENARRLAPALA
ncbi:MAG TPA: amidohydrolase family protein [Candidatus Sulfotelmatobacter sp.]|nr:amidohydrolase family protein [Candidatus Sulfotelmatobacter sp.]